MTGDSTGYDGTTPVEQSSVATPARPDAKQATVAAERGARVARRVIETPRSASVSPEEVEARPETGHETPTANPESDAFVTAAGERTPLDPMDDDVIRASGTAPAQQSEVST
ncbi:hypothetical protein VB773_00455 [Haloarculaceae archaeon H-GB2-1]|nr:hypothetical protein [Haloarculaceae archaeon H-GB1-1]MEA5388175.1 hypothetical protein [Haloarculaceae archaeon H-GB11]MEA5406195.1 hypothetical protein [Haloarculaceae archaeon H-GB2-1]